jgi:hypothetical protein
MINVDQFHVQAVNQWKVLGGRYAALTETPQHHFESIQ